MLSSDAKRSRQRSMLRDAQGRWITSRLHITKNWYFMPQVIFGTTQDYLRCEGERLDPMDPDAGQLYQADHVTPGIGFMSQLRKGLGLICKFGFV